MANWNRKASGCSKPFDVGIHFTQEELEKLEKKARELSRMDWTDKVKLIKQAHLSATLKLYVWQPKGHGELSWFVMATSEAEAKAAVDQEIKRRSLLPWHELDQITDEMVWGWGTDYYQLTVMGLFQPISNIELLPTAKAGGFP